MTKVGPNALEASVSRLRRALAAAGCPVPHRDGARCRLDAASGRRKVSGAARSGPPLAKVLARGLVVIAGVVFVVNSVAVGLYYGSDRRALEAEVVADIVGPSRRRGLRVGRSPRPHRFAICSRIIPRPMPTRWWIAAARCSRPRTPSSYRRGATDLYADDWFTRLAGPDGPFLVAGHEFEERSDGLRDGLRHGRGSRAPVVACLFRRDHRTCLAADPAAGAPADGCQCLSAAPRSRARRRRRRMGARPAARGPDTRRPRRGSRPRSPISWTRRSARWNAWRRRSRPRSGTRPRPPTPCARRSPSSRRVSMPCRPARRPTGCAPISRPCRARCSRCSPPPARRR